MFTRSLLKSYIPQQELLYTSTVHAVNQLQALNLLQNQTDMASVYNEIIILEEEYKALLKAKQTSQYHQQLELEKDRITISENRAAIEELNGQIAVFTGQANNIHHQSMEVLEGCRKLTLEIEHLRNQNTALQRDAELQLGDQVKLQKQINRQLARKARLEDQCNVLSKKMEEKLILLNDLEFGQKQLDKEKEELEKIKIIALSDNESLEKEKYQREISFKKTEIALAESLKEKEEIKLNLQNSQNENRVLENQNAHLLTKLQQEMQRFTETQLRLKAQLKSFSVAQAEVQKTLQVNKALKEQNEQLAKRNMQLVSNVETQLKEIELCEISNSTLKQEIQVFLTCEEKARNLLNFRTPLEVVENVVPMHFVSPGKVIRHLNR